MRDAGGLAEAVGGHGLATGSLWIFVRARPWLHFHPRIPVAPCECPSMGLLIAALTAPWRETGGCHSFGTERGIHAGTRRRAGTHPRSLGNVWPTRTGRVEHRRRAI